MLLSRSSFPLSVIFLLLISFTASTAQTAFPDSLKQNIDETVQRHTASFPEGTQLSMAFIRNGEVYYAGYLKEKDSLVRKENKKAVFEIGSLTKVFTSTILAVLDQEGVVDVNDPFNKGLGLDLKIKDEVAGQITLLSLSNHTSGLPRLQSDLGKQEGYDPHNPYVSYGPMEMKHYLAKKMKLSHAPGKMSDYSNLGAGLLGYVLELKSGKSYEELLQEKVCQPYGMTMTTTNREKTASQLVKGQDAKGMPASNWDFSVMQGAGAIKSNVTDLAAFVQANFEEDPVLEMQRKKTFTANDQIDLAMGWHIIKTGSGARWHWHNGGTGGYSSSLAMDTEKEQSVILLSNLSSFHSQHAHIDQLCFETMTLIR